MTRVWALGVILFALGSALPPASGEVAELKGPQGLALDRAGNLLVSCRGSNSVVVMARSGAAVREFGGDRLLKPGGLAVMADGRVVVANTGRNELAAFDAEGKFLTAAGGLSAPEDVAVGPDGWIYVADTGNSRIAVFDRTLEGVAFAIEEAGDPPAKLKQPAGVAIARGMLVVADTGSKRVLVLTPPEKGGSATGATVISREGMTPRFVAIGPGRRIYVSDEREVRGFTRRGEPAGSFAAKALRVTISYLFRPGGIAIDERGNVLAVDQYTSRVFVTNADLLDPVPRLRLDPKALTAATIEWTSPSPQPTRVDYGRTDDYGLQVKDAALATRHRAALKDLDRSTRYFYRIHKPFEMIPESSKPVEGFSLHHQKKYHQRLFEGNVSGNHTFASGPAPGKSDWAAFPVIVLVYKNVKFPAAKDGKLPAPNRVLDDQDIALLKSEMETYRTWAWRHSHCKLNLDFTYVIVEEERDHKFLGDRSRPLFEDVLKGVTAQGKSLRDFWTLLVVGTHGWYAHYLDGPVAGSEYEFGACFCGFGHGQKPGWWWFPTHEHGHLVHSVFMNSEIDDFGFPDAPWTMPGQFGEDFSFMAANYRRQPPGAWLTLRTGVIQTSADANGNGVPDDDPRVPLDEKRFGYAGPDALARLMAGIRTPGYAGDTDTDFEGKVHKLNPGELYWIDRRVPKGQITLDGKIVPGEWRELYSMPNLTTPSVPRLASPAVRGAQEPTARSDKPTVALKARLFAAWDKGSYYFAVQSNEAVSALFYLDGANDGWFHGRDNLRFSVRPIGAVGRATVGLPDRAGKDTAGQASRGTAEVSGAIWDFFGNQINLHDGQHWYRDAYKPGDIRAATGEEGGWHVIECAVPARPAVGIAPGAGAKFALRVHLTVEGPGPQPLSAGFFDGEDFVYDLRCVGGGLR